MTHEYTLLVDAVVLPGGGAPACESLAWAFGVVLALGAEAAVRSISRGDSAVLSAGGAYVVPAGNPLEVGADADLLVLARDPRAGDPGEPLAVVRGGHVVAGSLAVLRADAGDGHHGFGEHHGAADRGPAA